MEKTASKKRRLLAAADVATAVIEELDRLALDKGWEERTEHERNEFAMFVMLEVGKAQRHVARAADTLWNVLPPRGGRPRNAPRPGGRDEGRDRWRPTTPR